LDISNTAAAADYLHTPSREIESNRDLLVVYTVPFHEKKKESKLRKQIKERKLINK